MINDGHDLSLDHIRRSQPQPGSLHPAGSAETWRTLASRLADEAEVVLQNAHWEVSYGSGDLRNTIKAIRTAYRADMLTPPNSKIKHGE